MAQTSYEYSILNDTINGVVDLDGLIVEIEATDLSATFDYLSTHGDSMMVWFTDALSGADQTSLDSLVYSHDGENVPKDGEIVYDTTSKYHYMWDDVRQLWLTENRHMYAFTRANNSSGMYLGLGTITSSDFHYQMAHAATITGVCCKATNGNKAKQFEIRDGVSQIFSFAFGEDGMPDLCYMNPGLSVNLDQGAKLKFWVDRHEKPVKNVRCFIEIAWRHVE